MHTIGTAVYVCLMSKNAWSLESSWENRFSGDLYRNYACTINVRCLLGFAPFSSWSFAWILARFHRCLYLSMCATNKLHAFQFHSVRFYVHYFISTVFSFSLSLSASMFPTLVPHGSVICRTKYSHMFRLAWNMEQTNAKTSLLLILSFNKIVIALQVNERYWKQIRNQRATKKGPATSRQSLNGDALWPQLLHMFCIFMWWRKLHLIGEIVLQSFDSLAMWNGRARRGRQRIGCRGWN